MAEKKPKLRSPEEVQAGLDKLRAEFDYYCGVTSQKSLELANKVDDEIAQLLGWKSGKHAARQAVHYAQIETEATYRAKIKALYWALGEEEL